MIADKSGLAEAGEPAAAHEDFLVHQYAAGIARMVDVVGIDHVGLGSDQLGMPKGSTMPSYADLPQLATALRTRFTAEEAAKLLGGN